MDKRQVIVLALAILLPMALRGQDFKIGEGGYFRNEGVDVMAFYDFYQIPVSPHVRHKKGLLVFPTPSSTLSISYWGNTREATPLPLPQEWAQSPQPLRTEQPGLTGHTFREA